MRRGCLILLLLIGSGGCISYILPMNIGIVFDPSDATLALPEGAVLKSVAERDDVLQLEVRRADGAGNIIGFISPLDAHHGGLVLLFDGAATFQAGASVGAALDHYDDYGAELRAAGFATWALQLAECATAYGDGDLADALEVVDWLEHGGKEFLGVERVYVIGYSTGATVANLLNTQREFEAIISLGGLTQPDQLEQLYNFYATLAELFAHNIGFCQLGATLRTYGQPGAPEWAALDAVSRIEQFRSPMLFIQGNLDVVYFLNNQISMQQRYEALRDAGVQRLAELEFIVLPNRTHFSLREDADVRMMAVEYLLRFEPE